jgi:hypothetical protein
MAYGLLAVNSNNETVLQDEYTTMALTNSGTLSPNASSSRIGVQAYGYRVTGTSAAPPNNTTELFVEVDVGGWYCEWGYGLAGVFSGTRVYSDFALSQIVSTSSTMKWYHFDLRTNLPNPTSGYGAAVFNTTGQCVWSSDAITNRVVDAGDTVNDPATNYVGSTITVPSTNLANAAYLRQGTGKWVDSGSFMRGYGIIIERTGTTTWRPSVRIVDYHERDFNQSFNFGTTKGNFMLAKV